MKRSTATRRLVKSPPELWAELSSEDSLARHLAEFGEIRITRVKPETTVAWEGDRASGTVELAPTGWGTKVILTATPAEAVREETAPVTARAAERPSAPVEPEVYAPAGPARIGPRLDPAPRPAPREPARIELRPQPARPEPAPPEEPRGFFARLFRKRAPAAPPRATAPVPPAPDPAASIPAPPAPTPDPSPPAPAPEPGPLPPPAPDPVPPTPAPQPPPPPQIRALDAERTVAILTEVLDDLGSAHHRPFSRDQD